MLKKYQPERTDFLINTQWGVPRAEVSADEASRKGMVLFHGRWVTKDERRQIRDEYQVYRSIWLLGVVMICMALPLLINLGAISQQGLVSGALAVGYAMALVAGGYGLMVYARPAHYLACLICLSFIVVPFTPLFQDVKEAPLLIVMGIMGLYYLLRKTARRVFRPFAPALALCLLPVVMGLLVAPAGLAAAADDNADLLEQFLGRKLEPAKPLEIPKDMPPSEALFFYLNKGYGAAEVIREFLAKGADANYGDPEYRITLLHNVAHYGHADATRVLIAAGAKVNAVNGEGNTPLFAAVHEGHNEIARMLLDAGAEVNIPNTFRFTALRAACEKNNPELVRLLLAKGADVNFTDNKGNTPLHVAVDKMARESARLLIQGGADLNAIGRYGDTPLHAAVSYGDEELVQLLLERGADSSIRNGKGQTPLEVAEEHRFATIVKLLKQRGRTDI